MFRRNTCITIVLLSLHTAYSSSIFIISKLDDVSPIDKPASSMAHQLNETMRSHEPTIQQHQRLINQENKAHVQTDPNVEPPVLPATGHPTREKTDAVHVNGKNGYIDIWKPDYKVIAQELNAPISDSSNEASEETNAIKPHQVKKRDHASPELPEMSKNVTSSLKSIKKMLEQI